MRLLVRWFAGSFVASVVLANEGYLVLSRVAIDSFTFGVDACFCMCVRQNFNLTNLTNLAQAAGCDVRRRGWSGRGRWRRRFLCELLKFDVMPITSTVAGRRSQVTTTTGTAPNQCLFVPSTCTTHTHDTGTGTGTDGVTKRYHRTERHYQHFGPHSESTCRR